MTEDQTSSTAAGKRNPGTDQETRIGQRLRAEELFQRGRDQRQHTGTTTPSPSSAALPFPPVATHQGVVTSFEHAEWLLVRTVARIHDREQRGLPGYQPDQNDQHALASALGESCGLSAHQFLGKLAPQIAARVQQMERGPVVAAELGRKHGHAGIRPYGDLDIEGDAALMNVLGETEWTTDANHPYRMALAAAYTEAHRTANAQRPIASIPARMAALEFPPSPAAPGPGASTIESPMSHPRAKSGVHPEHSIPRHGR